MVYDLCGASVGDHGRDARKQAFGGDDDGGTVEATNDGAIDFGPRLHQYADGAQRVSAASVLASRAPGRGTNAIEPTTSPRAAAPAARARA